MRATICQDSTGKFTKLKPDMRHGPDSAYAAVGDGGREVWTK